MVSHTTKAEPGSWQSQLQLMSSLKAGRTQCPLPSVQGSQHRRRVKGSVFFCHKENDCEAHGETAGNTTFITSLLFTRMV